jgi:hypothetical protein
MLGGLWLISVLAGLSGDQGTYYGDGGWAALYVPVVGPWVGIGTLNASGVGAAVLVLDGLGQVGGAAMIVLGIALPKKQLIRDDLGKSTLTVAPMLTGRTVGITGTF